MAAASRNPPTPRWRLLPRAASLPPPPSCSLRSQRHRPPHRRKSRRPPAPRRRPRRRTGCAQGPQPRRPRRHQRLTQWQLRRWRRPSRTPRPTPNRPASGHAAVRRGNLRARQLSRCHCIAAGMKLSGAHHHQVQAKAHSWVLGLHVLMGIAQRPRPECHHLMLLQRMRLQWVTAKDLWIEHQTHLVLPSHWHHHPVFLAAHQRWGCRHGPVLKGHVSP